MIRTEIIIYTGLSFLALYIFLSLGLLLFRSAPDKSSLQTEPTEPKKVAECEGVTVWYLQSRMDKWPIHHVYFTTPGGHISVY